MRIAVLGDIHECWDEDDNRAGKSLLLEHVPATHQHYLPPITPRATFIGIFFLFARTAVEGLGADVVLFVGDIGNEDVELVRMISRIRTPMAVILGNHDCWETMRSKLLAYSCSLGCRGRAVLDCSLVL